MLVSRPVLAAVVLASCAATLRAQSPVIDHAEIKCLVVGKYRKMPAKFQPADVAQPRVYFRPEGVPSWYYVEMKPEAPLGHVGVLPKPTKQLVKKHIEYYVEAASRAFDTGRTPEYAPIVVAKEGDCDRDPVVPLYAKNPPSAVFPSLPPGFAMAGAAGIGTAAAVVGGGAAVAGAVILATRDDETTTTSTSTTSTTTSTTSTTTSTTSTTLATGRFVSCQSDVREGVVPLTVKFSAQSTIVADFLWDFGDGATSTQVNPSHTYTVPGVYQAAVRASNGALVDTCTRTVTAQPAGFDLAVSTTTGGSVSGPGIACPGDCGETYSPGTVVTLSAVPAGGGGTTFSGWGGDCAGTAPTCTVTMSQARSVSASFQPVPPPAFTLNVTIVGAGTVAGPGIACAPDCSESFPAGTVVTLTATGTGGSTFVGWGGGGCTGSGTCTIPINGPTNVTATFAPPVGPFPLAVTVAGAGTGTVTGTGINCPGDCAETLPAGTPVTLTATPTGGSIFAGFTGDCTGTTCNLTMDGPRNVTATFTVTAPFTLTVSVGGGGTGTLTAPGINCPGDCTETYPPGTPVALTATPTGSSSFGAWTGDCLGTTGTVCNLTMTANRTAGATFNPPVILTLTVIGPATATSQVVAFPPAVTCTGAPSPGNTCTVPFTLGATATLVPTGSGGLVAFWSGDCAGTPDNGNCTLPMTANRSATATFAIPTVTDAARTGSTVVSRLEAAGARLSAALNDVPLPPPPPGASSWTVEPRTGDNRLEAQVQAGGAGTWRLELTGVRGLEPGTLRVLAGEVVSVGPDAVVFRLKGRAGERVSLAFTVR
jgi:PKD repeat protein